MKKVIIITVSVIFLLLCWTYFDVIKYANSIKIESKKKRVITISQGESFDTILKRLCGEGLLSSPFKARLFAIIKGYDRKIKAGEYILSNSMSPSTIFDILIKGRVRLHRLTISEGLNIKQIAKLVSEAGYCQEAEFARSATDSVLAKKLGISQKTLEGYLFPDTYYFSKDTCCDDIISTMLARFFSVFSNQWEKRLKELNFSMHQIVTLASIIEKETGVKEERELISSVFHNRLKKNMRLESDPTVIYGIKDFDGNIRKKDLLQFMPYNTYRIKGLPPGPIANPGEDAIYAAIFPAKTDFYYFVAKKDGTHKFSNTIEEHNKAVREYQLQR